MNNAERFLNESSRPAIPPAGLAERISAAAVRDYRVRKIRRVATRSTAIAIAVVALGWMVKPKPASNGIVHRPIINPLTETHQLFASTARKVDVPSIRLPDLSSMELPSLEPSRELMMIPDRAKTSIEPVTGTMSRAANRWRKDFGSAFGIPQPRM
jgi:hypothetical protein